MNNHLQREPILKGAPNYFRYCVIEAQKRMTLAHDVNTGGVIRADYSHPGWHLAIHVEDYTTDEALEDLERLSEIEDPEEFKACLFQFFDREFPGCIALIPHPRRKQFMKGVLSAIADGRFPIKYDLEGLLGLEED